MRMILLTSGIVVLLTTVAFFAYEMFAFSQSTVRQLRTLGTAIATNSAAALAFQNADDASSVLTALQAEPHIVAAALYDNAGHLFAIYPAQLPAAALPMTPTAQGYRYEHGMLSGFQDVNQGGRRLGTLYVRSDLGAIYERVTVWGILTMLVVAVSLAVAYLVSSRLQRQLSTPILALAGVAKSVSDSQDFTVRVPLSGTFEVDQLTECFNHMLMQIERSEGRLLAQLSRLRLLQEITHGTGNRLDLQSMFHVVLGTLEQSLAIDFGCLCIYDSAAESLTVSSVGAASRTFCGALDLDEQCIVPIDQNGLSTCIKGQLVYEPDTRKIPFPFPQRLAKGGLLALVFAPLIVENNVFGVLVAARREAESFSSPDCEFLKQLSEHVALATHQAQLYSALQQAYDDLRQTQHTVMQQERLRALGQMASGIAHDINNAISPVSLYTDTLLEREPNLSERTRSYLTTIRRAIEDVAGTVARMREFYRQREPQLTLAQIDINHSIEQVVELTRPRWFDLPQQRGIDIDLQQELAADLPRIMGADGEIRDALTNLIFNAVDAMPQGGTITLRTRAIPGPEERQTVQLEVSDSGVGMSEETRRRCLEPFFTTKGERGTGLGLAMVYGMIQRHSAELEIDSVAGQGTTVRLSFQVYSEQLATPGAASEVTALVRRLRILLVDDDPLLIKALQDTLEEDGHVITATNGGQAGIDAFTAAHSSGNLFQVVITDLGMPHVDGRKVAAAIKSISPSTPIILLTGWGQRLVAENDVPPHVNRVLNKPPKLQQLRTALAELAA
ncbi:MAG TPA: ATP-binding protein [Steroidobacteraceae bacterium]|jgi:signal transduction histidine kinase/ActR/RegA family two-component response regulator